ncbi:MAG: fibronectin type III domain-containing protein [Gammaproteobacteria bacterium]|nr:fibronectin type III domain-containing protein [Gammaproteobacteria bacterium]
MAVEQMTISGSATRGLHARARVNLAMLVCAFMFAQVCPQLVRAAPDGATSAPPTLSTDTQVATAGFFTLSWYGSSGDRFELQESASRGFRTAVTIYEGPDAARVMSGQEEGRYFYRVRDASQAGAWSQPVAVDIDHHPLPRALGFFAAGLLVFAATASVILIGAARTRNA